MLNLPDLDPAIANAAYIELRDSLAWVFADASSDMLALRNHALASIAELSPATALEARFAARVVALDIHSMDSLHDAAEHRDDHKRMVQCRNQCSAMGREMRRAHAELKALQTARRMKQGAQDWFNQYTSRGKSKAAAMPELDQPPAAAPEAHVLPPAPSKAAVPSSAAREVAAPLPARSDVAPPPAARSDVAPPVPARSEAAVPPATAREAGAAPPAPSTDPQPRPAQAADFPPAALAKAEQYARQNRLLARRIRCAGGLTAQAVAGFRPSNYPRDREVLRALVHGTSPILLALDEARRDSKAA